VSLHVGVLQLFLSRQRVRLFLMDVEDETDDDVGDTSRADCRNTSCELTSETEDTSYANLEMDDENKENSLSDTTVELLL